MSDRIINDTILKAACAGDLAPLKGVAKTDLHTHLVLSAPFSTYTKLSAGRIKPPPERFNNLDHFLEFVRAEFFPLLNSIEAYLQITRDAFEHMIADGIVYTETSFDLIMPLLINYSWAELVEALKPEIERVSHRLCVCPELGLARDFPFENWDQQVEAALATGFFKSIDLYGAETLKTVDHFAAYFTRARAAGTKIKIHSGETGAPARVLEEVATVKPAAVQHGVRASEDARVMEALARSAVEVNVCPWSNYCLRVVDTYASHPIRKLYDAGVCVTINSDDYAVFGKSVSEEYMLLYKLGVFNAAELEQIRQNGLRAQRNFLSLRK